MKKISLILAVVLVLSTIGFATFQSRYDKEFCEILCGAEGHDPGTPQFIQCVTDCMKGIV